MVGRDRGGVGRMNDLHMFTQMSREESQMMDNFFFSFFFFQTYYRRASCIVFTIASVSHNVCPWHFKNDQGISLDLANYRLSFENLNITLKINLMSILVIVKMKPYLVKGSSIKSFKNAPSLVQYHFYFSPI